MLKTPKIKQVLDERKIILEDGRYLIFFTFSDEDGKDTDVKNTESLSMSNDRMNIEEKYV